MNFIKSAAILAIVLFQVAFLVQAGFDFYQGEQLGANYDSTKNFLLEQVVRPQTVESLTQVTKSGASAAETCSQLVSVLRGPIKNVALDFSDKEILDAGIEGVEQANGQPELVKALKACKKHLQ